MLTEFNIILPELILAIIAVIAQIFAVFCKQYTRLIINIVAGLIITVILTISLMPKEQSFESAKIFTIGEIIGYYKIFIVAITVIAIGVYNAFCKIASIEPRMEAVTLFLLSTLGIFLSISSSNLLLLFCGVELQALCGYALAGISNNSKAAEGAVKYFVLGAVLSCISLFGISFLYGFSGSIDFAVIADNFNQEETRLGLVVGIIFLLCGMLFKLSVAPFHMWTSDVYEGSSISIVTYFATVPKIGGVLILLNIINNLVGNNLQAISYIIKLAAIFSMLIGSLGAIMQTSLKRLMAYSTILNIGYTLAAISLGNHEGALAAILYVAIYLISALGFFICLITLLGARAEYASFKDISGITFSKKNIAVMLTIIVFSMIGLPPLAGFFSKYYVFYNAIQQEEYILAIIGVCTSVIAGYYYLKIIKSIYFAEEIFEEKLDLLPPPTSSLLLGTSYALTSLLLFSSIFLLFSDYLLAVI